MQKYSDEELSEILDKLSDEMKNTLIKALMENDRKNVSVVETPIYENIMDFDGNVIGQAIVATKYGISVMHKADESPHRQRDFMYSVNYVNDNHMYKTVIVNKDSLEKTIYEIFDNGGFEVKITCIEKWN